MLISKQTLRVYLFFALHILESLLSMNYIHYLLLHTLLHTYTLTNTFNVNFIHNIKWYWIKTKNWYDSIINILCNVSKNCNIVIMVMIMIILKRNNLTINGVHTRYTTRLVTFPGYLTSILVILWKVMPLVHHPHSSFRRKINIGTCLYNRINIYKFGNWYWKIK